MELYQNMRQEDFGIKMNVNDKLYFVAEYSNFNTK